MYGGEEESIEVALINRIKIANISLMEILKVAQNVSLLCCIPEYKTLFKIYIHYYVF